MLNLNESLQEIFDRLEERSNDPVKAKKDLKALLVKTATTCFEKKKRERGATPLEANVPDEIGRLIYGCMPAHSPGTATSSVWTKQEKQIQLEHSPWLGLQLGAATTFSPRSYYKVDATQAEATAADATQTDDKKAITVEFTPGSHSSFFPFNEEDRNTLVLGKSTFFKLKKVIWLDLQFGAVLQLGVKKSKAGPLALDVGEHAFQVDGAVLEVVVRFRFADDINGRGTRTRHVRILGRNMAFVDDRKSGAGAGCRFAFSFGTWHLVEGSGSEDLDESLSFDVDSDSEDEMTNAVSGKVIVRRHNYRGWDEVCKVPADIEKILLTLPPYAASHRPPPESATAKTTTSIRHPLTVLEELKLLGLPESADVLDFVAPSPAASARSIFFRSKSLVRNFRKLKEAVGGRTKDHTVADVDKKLLASSQMMPGPRSEPESELIHSLLSETSSLFPLIPRRAAERLFRFGDIISEPQPALSELVGLLLPFETAWACDMTVKRHDPDSRVVTSRLPARLFDSGYDDTGSTLIGFGWFEDDKDEPSKIVPTTPISNLQDVTCTVVGIEFAVTESVIVSATQALLVLKPRDKKKLGLAILMEVFLRGFGVHPGSVLPGVPAMGRAELQLRNAILFMSARSKPFGRTRAVLSLVGLGDFSRDRLTDLYRYVFEDLVESEGEYWENDEDVPRTNIVKKAVRTQVELCEKEFSDAVEAQNRSLSGASLDVDLRLLSTTDSDLPATRSFRLTPKSFRRMTQLCPSGSSATNVAESKITGLAVKFECSPRCDYTSSSSSSSSPSSSSRTGGPRAGGKSAATTDSLVCTNPWSTLSASLGDSSEAIGTITKTNAQLEQEQNTTIHTVTGAACSFKLHSVSLLDLELGVLFRFKSSVESDLLDATVDVALRFETGEKGDPACSLQESLTSLLLQQCDGTTGGAPVELAVGAVLDKLKLLQLPAKIEGVELIVKPTLLTAELVDTVSRRAILTLEEKGAVCNMEPQQEDHLSRRKPLDKPLMEHFVQSLRTLQSASSTTTTYTSATTTEQDGKSSLLPLTTELFPSLNRTEAEPLLFAGDVSALKAFPQKSRVAIQPLLNLLLFFQPAWAAGVVFRGLITQQRNAANLFCRPKCFFVKQNEPVQSNKQNKLGVVEGAQDENMKESSESQANCGKPAARSCTGGIYVGFDLFFGQRNDDYRYPPVLPLATLQQTVTCTLSDGHELRFSEMKPISASSSAGEGDALETDPNQRETSICENRTRTGKNPVLVVFKKPGPRSDGEIQPFLVMKGTTSTVASPPTAPGVQQAGGTPGRAEQEKNLPGEDQNQNSLLIKLHHGVLYCGQPDRCHRTEEILSLLEVPETRSLLELGEKLFTTREILNDSCTKKDTATEAPAASSPSTVEQQQPHDHEAQDLQAGSTVRNGDKSKSKTTSTKVLNEDEVTGTAAASSSQLFLVREIISTIEALETSAISSSDLKGSSSSEPVSNTEDKQ
ncbi:unnamed protein product [Amoebophrya sp. A120]|nr:unnamed protein product [Amoebophrya sp. A120]|eukprot:GSA120T00025292001.1